MMTVPQLTKFWNFLSKYSKFFLISTSLLVFSIFVHRAFLIDTTYKGDDFTHHTLRTASYYLALKDGQFPVRWGPNLNQGFGYPSFNYMYHTPYILGSFLFATGFSVQQSVNLVILFASIGTLLFSYYFFTTVLKSHRLGILGAILYSFNPYILLTIYWRGAVGELLFYMAIPLFLLGIYLFVKNEKKRLIYAIFTLITTAFLILSHLPSLILLFPVLAVFLYSYFKDKLTRNLVFLLILLCVGAFGVTSWYWLPAILEQNLVQYVSAGSLQQYQTQFLSLLQTIKIFTNTYSSDLFQNVIHIGGASAVILCVFIYLLTAKKIKYSNTIFAWFVLFVVSLILSTYLSNTVWDVSKLLSYIQFPWRFLWPANFAVIFIAMQILKSKDLSKLFKMIFYIALVLISLFTIQGYAVTKGTEPRSNFDWFHPTFETGSSFDEHQPVTANFPYPFETEIMFATQSATTQDQAVQSADRIIKNVKITGTHISFNTTIDEDITVIIKRLFYPGWEARLEEEKTEILTNFPNYEGVIAVVVPKETNFVQITFTDTTSIRTVAEVISVLSCIIILLTISYKIIKRKQ